MNPWNVILVTAALAAIVSFAVSGIIHVLCLLIRRFSKAAPVTVCAKPAAAETGAEIAIAIAAAKACIQ